jgi:hypothetical protein
MPLPFSIPKLPSMELECLTAEFLRELFYYENGRLYCKYTYAKGVSPGDEAAVINKNGHKIVRIQRHKYHEHQLIWIYHGNDPVVDLERIDGDCLNNSIENLIHPKESSINERMLLSDPQRGGNKNSIFSWKKICYVKEVNKWKGIVRYKRKAYNLGLFTDKHECEEAVKEFRTKLHTGLIKP